MVNGRTGVSKDTESGKAKTAIPILESGKIPKLTVTEFTPGPQVINMKVIVIRNISKTSFIRIKTKISNYFYRRVEGLIEVWPGN